MIVQKIENKMLGGYNLELKEEDITVTISYEGVMDYFFWAFVKSNPKKEKIELVIKKEDGELYSLFDKLYQDCFNCNIYEDKTSNKRLFKTDMYKKLFEKGYLSWQSDDGVEDEVDTLNIHQEKDRYRLEFIRKSSVFHHGTMVRIRTSGSRYEPFWMAFSKFYTGIQTYEPNYHQITLEEYYGNKVYKKS